MCQSVFFNCEREMLEHSWSGCPVHIGLLLPFVYILNYVNVLMDVSISGGAFQTFITEQK